MKPNKSKTKKPILKEKEDFDFSSLLSPYCNSSQIEIFKSNLNNKPLSGLILNKKKISKEELKKQFPFLIEDKEDDFLYQYESKNQISKSLLNFIGCFYLLDISSAIISYYVEKYLPKNSLVLDMASAPGGKSISLSLRRDDLLFISNDISIKRQFETNKNINRLGLDNILTISIDPLKLNDKKIFDIIILDTPCSGSGMIRKDIDIKNDYSISKVNNLLPIQKDLLNKTDKLLKDGGYIIYSTCSLSTSEDEEQVESFLNEHGYEEIDLNIKDETIIKGINNHGYHLIPGIYKGEGIYFTLLKKNGMNNVNHQELNIFDKKEDLNIFEYKNNKYVVSKMYEEISKFNFLMPGLKIYNDEEYKKCDFDYAYSKANKTIKKIELSKEEAIKLISFNELKVDCQNEELVIFTYLNNPICFGKIIDKKVKNFLPKGLKTNLIF